MHSQSCRESRMSLPGDFARSALECDASSHRIPAPNFALCRVGQVRRLLPAMANANPQILYAQGISEHGRKYLLDAGRIFWIIVNTFQYTFERIQHGRLPIQAANFYRPT